MRTIALFGALAVVAMFGVYVQSDVPGFSYKSNAQDTAAVLNAQGTLSLSITASPTVVAKGKPSTLVWGAAGFQSCSVTGPALAGSGLRGSRSTGPLIAASTYILTCQTKAGAVSSQSVTVGIQPPTKNSETAQ